MKRRKRLLLNSACLLFGLALGLLLTWFGTMAYCNKIIADSGDPSAAGVVGHLAGYFLLILLPLGAIGGLFFGAVCAEIIVVLRDANKDPPNSDICN